jgi:hypothetical protein
LLQSPFRVSTLVGLFVIAPLVFASAPTAAVSTVYSIEIDNVLGVFSFVDPAGFSCTTGSAPMHSPPNSIERRCTPTFVAITCGDLSAAGTIDGLPGASLQVNAQCSDGNLMPPFAGCAATIPAFAVSASCANTPPPQQTPLAFEFVCHAPASGAWIQFHAKCVATIVT